VYASTLSRARDTAAAIAAKCLVPAPGGTTTEAGDSATAAATGGESPVLLEPGLVETCLGHWQGLTWDQVNERHEAEATRWRTDPAARMVGGESMHDRFHRVALAIHAIALAHLGRTVVLVVSGWVSWACATA
jgi:broad specificity phosphatase PhoE